MKVYILYENPDWNVPLVRELKKAGIPYEEWFVQAGCFDLGKEPPEGVFLNRMSPSSHTRGHWESVDYTRALLTWLEAYGRRVINGSQAFELEMSKIKQYVALKNLGIRTPYTMAVSGREPLKAAARNMPLPFITKHNRGGKGLGVRKFEDLQTFDAYVDSDDFVPSPDHITLLQEYVQPAEPFITRVEIVDGQFLYAIKADTSQGFLLCPAPCCEVGDTVSAPSKTPPGANFDNQSLFSLREDFDDPVIQQYIQFMAKHRIAIAGIEFIEDSHGNKITYDINGTTNYSPAVEEQHGLNGMAAVASLCGRLLREAGSGRNRWQESEKNLEPLFVN